MKTILSILLFFIATNLFAQDFELPADVKEYYLSFYGKSNTAYEAYKAKDYQKSIELYQSFFKDKNFNPSKHGGFYESYATVLLEFGDTKKATDYHKKAVRYDKAQFNQIQLPYYRTEYFAGNEVVYDQMVVECEKIHAKY